MAMPSKNNPKSTARKVIEVATQLFARLGFDGVSVRDICREAQVSENAVHYHYKSKNGLYQTIIHGFGEELLQSARRALSVRPLNAAELRTRLEIFMEETIISFLENRDLLQIVFSEFMQLMPHCDDEVSETFMGHHKLVHDFISAASKTGILKPDLDPEIFSSAIIEPIAMRVLHCESGLKYERDGVSNSTYCKSWIQQHLNILLEGALVHE